MTRIDKNVRFFVSLFLQEKMMEPFQLPRLSENQTEHTAKFIDKLFSPHILYRRKVGESLMGFVISPKELKARLDKGDKLVLVDVREEWEYSLAKLDGSTLIPLGTLPQSLARLSHDSEIIAICHHGMRSADATNFLLQQGFTKVKNLVGGIDAWSIQVDGTVPRY
jgi:rhodanese-related sulfurtransferase